MIEYTVAIVDDEESIRDSLEMVLSHEYAVQLFEDAETFIESLDREPPDLVLMDIGLPRMNGIEAMARIKGTHPGIPVVMITAYEDISMVIQSMKGGAFDFIIKPINPDIMELTIQKAVASIALTKEVHLLQEKFLKANEPCFIGESKNIENVMDFIDMVAQSPDTPIMILGETGTGKELIAKAIHARSPVFQGPFVAVNCSAFPEDLIESELFGYEPGAFSGARPQGKRGFIEEADQGTLFLDEVADLSAAGQAKLLRFLESSEFYKVGGTRKLQVQTRVVSATNKDIQALVETEKFRKDLFFRLCVVHADIPSLNQRPDDILPLAKHFLHEFNTKFRKDLKGFSDEAVGVLLSHTFTGNVRELKNIIERSVLVAKTALVSVDDLGLGPRSPARPPNSRPEEVKPVTIPEEGVHLGDILNGIERRYMALAVEQAGGNESRAAKLLNMNHHTFRYRWKKLRG
ncbi:MAG: sigma-54-dependent Fis family transcriptional regulator [Desulfobacter sp.]|nr:MAG: sigma-54-dependent Fis family transcriptional regulator [Desulfobacter sp.]